MQNKNTPSEQCTERKLRLPLNGPQKKVGIQALMMQAVTAQQIQMDFYWFA